jgi:hypothetical protein
MDQWREHGLETAVAGIVPEPGRYIQAWDNTPISLWLE